MKNRLEITYGECTGVEVVDSGHPLVVPFRWALDQGAVTGDWRQIFVKAPGVEKRLLGTFVRTTSGKVLYFPGVRMRSTEGRMGSQQLAETSLDHFTADPPRDGKVSTHLAFHGLPHEASRGFKSRARPRAGAMFPWLSLLLPSVERLTPLPNRLTVPITFSPRDAKAFVRRLGLSPEEGGWRSLMIPAPEAPPPFHFQADIWLGYGRGWHERAARSIHYTSSNSAMIRPAPDGNHARREHLFQFAFTEKLGLKIAISRPPGELKWQGFVCMPCANPPTGTFAVGWPRPGLDETE